MRQLCLKIWTYKDYSCKHILHVSATYTTEWEELRESHLEEVFLALLHYLTDILDVPPLTVLIFRVTGCSFFPFFFNDFSQQHTEQFRSTMKQFFLLEGTKWQYVFQNMSKLREQERCGLLQLVTTFRLSEPRQLQC